MADDLNLETLDEATASEFSPAPGPSFSVPPLAGLQAQRCFPTLEAWREHTAD